MKKCALIFTIFFGPVSIFAQVPTDSANAQMSHRYEDQIQHYLLKNKNQKRLAWIFLGGGALLNAVASSANSNGDNISAQGIISGVGGLAEIASIPLFFSAAKNRDRARLVNFQKNIASAASDSLRQIYVDDAVSYFRGKASSDRVTAFVLSGIGTGMLIAGAFHGTNENDFFLNNWFSAMMIITGVTADLISIPFFVRAGSNSRLAKDILRKGSVPDPKFVLYPSIQSGHKYLMMGIHIPL